MKMMSVAMSDGTVWAVPVDVIAKDRAAYYAHEFDNDIERSLKEDTLPLFEDEYNIIDWAENNMSWGEAEDLAIKVCTRLADYHAEWVRGSKGFLEMEVPSHPETPVG